MHTILTGSCTNLEKEKENISKKMMLLKDVNKMK